MFVRAVLRFWNNVSSSVNLNGDGSMGQRGNRDWDTQIIAYVEERYMK